MRRGNTGDWNADEGLATLHGKAVARSQRVEEGKLSNTQAFGSHRGDTSETRVGACIIEGDHPAHGLSASDEDVDSDKYVSDCGGTRPTQLIARGRVCQVDIFPC